MMKKKIYLLLFILGLSSGVFFAINKAKATSPEGESSSGETNPSIYYDEVWKAVQTLVSSASGYVYFYPYGNPPGYPYQPPSNTRTGTAGSFENPASGSGWIVNLFPKMVVTKWKVHGHIHFR